MYLPQFGSVPGALTGAALLAAVQANRRLARQIGWGCVVSGQTSAIPEVLRLLGLASSPREEDLAHAIARYQTTAVGLRETGQLDLPTWRHMLARGVIPTPRFRQQSWRVFWGPRELGILEKTNAYLPFNNGVSGGVSIQMGFRVTNMDAVRSAGFVDASGEDNFRWIQILTTNRPSVEPDERLFIKKHIRYVDPGRGPRDAHPYYWDNEGEGDPGLRINAFRNRQAVDRDRPNASRLCYDLIFADIPRRPLSDAVAGRRVYWNAETALVGVKTGQRNVILNTFLWGFDIVIEGGRRNIRLNALQAGRVGGSATFRQALNQARRVGHFPGHCFEGGDFTGAGRCIIT